MNRSQENASVISRNNEGICLTCNNAPTCIYLKATECPVLQCEEFEGYESVPVKATTSAGVELEGDFGKYKGLCVNCGHRETCIFPKQDGDIWYCEEYQ